MNLPQQLHHDRMTKILILAALKCAEGDEQDMQEITASIAIAKDISINAALVVVTLRRDQRMTLKAFLFGKDTNPD